MSITFMFFKRFCSHYQLGVLFVLLLLCVSCSKPHEFAGTEFPNIDAAPEIVGIAKGQDFQLSSLDDKVVIVFFGYTYCPDICPITMSEIQRAYEQTGATAEDAAVLLVTVDPERDTPEVLDAYASAFDPDFFGVHVEVAEQDQLKKNYFVFAEKEAVDDDAENANYLVTHSDQVYLIDRDGNLRVVYRGADLVVEELASDIAYLMAN